MKWGRKNPPECSFNERKRIIIDYYDTPAKGTFVVELGELFVRVAVSAACHYSLQNGGDHVQMCLTSALPARYDSSSLALSFSTEQYMAAGKL